jgi:hypothetical protein
MSSNQGGASVLKLQDPMFKDKDGGGGMPPFAHAEIDVAINGYIVTTVLADGTAETAVYTDFDDVIKFIRAAN